MAYLGCISVYLCNIYLNIEPLRRAVRNSPSQMFFKIGVLKNITIFTGKHLCCSLFLIKLHVWRPATLLRRDTNAVVFRLNLRNPEEHLFLQKTSVFPFELLSRKVLKSAYICNVLLSQERKGSDNLEIYYHIFRPCQFLIARREGSHETF